MLEPVELKPCPFCGGDASDAGHIKYSRPLCDTWWSDGTSITEAYYVNCKQCGQVRAPFNLVGGYQTKDEAIAAWNRRATPEPAADLVEGMARALIEALGNNAFHFLGKIEDASRAALAFLAPHMAARERAAHSAAIEVAAEQCVWPDDVVCDTTFARGMRMEAQIVHEAILALKEPRP